MAHLVPELVDFILAWLPKPPASIVEIGCGPGSLTRILGERGYDAIGVDPEAPDATGFIRDTLEEFEPDSEFDAAVAVRSMHHLHDMGRAIDNLASALKQGARLVAFEFAVENIDAAADGWLAAHGLPRPVSDPTPDDIIPLGVLVMALAPHFRTLLAEPTTYLAREADREDLVGEEQRAVDAGEIKPAGMRLVLERI